MKLELNNIYKSFGEKKVLKGISFSSSSGTAFGLLGRNGAGKTTTIRILMDVFPADSGEILCDGKPLDRKTVRIGYLPEERGLYPKKPIIDQLLYFAQLHGMKRKDALSAIDYWLSRLGMEEYRNRKLEILSKGNQQKIQLVTALAHDPDIIILDEPFSGLDPVNAMLLKDVVKEEIEKGKIVLFSSHQMNYIEEFCENIAILADGQIAVSGNLREIKRGYVRDKLVIRSSEEEAILRDFASSCTRTEHGALLLKLGSAEEKASAMRRLTETYDIDEISVYEPSLNDIFIEYAGDGPADSVPSFEGRSGSGAEERGMAK